MRRSLRRATCAALFACGATAAGAQRTQENAVTSASDAFGSQIGNERIGLYQNDDVRGFNPVEAGNARIDGLYFDQQERPTSRLIEGSTIRVGITAQGFPFPAPTGVVDYRLRETPDKLAFGVEFERAAFGGLFGSFDANIPLAPGLALSANLIARRFAQPQGGHNNLRGYGATLRWQGKSGAELVGFFGGFGGRDEDPIPNLFPAGDELPPAMARGIFLGQDWDRKSSYSNLGGLVGKLPLGDWRIEAGVFRSAKVTGSSFSDLMRGVRPDGSVASRVIIADADNADVSVSGEVRVTRSFATGPVTHRLIASARGRAKDRDFGGQATIALGASTVNAPDLRARPSYTLGANDHDRVRQMTLGVGYSLNWPGRGALSLSVSRSDYRKAVDFANPAVADLAVSSTPMLYNISGSVVLSRQLTLFGGYVKGLEESLIAPDIATNRNEAPPAIITEQAEAGVRVAVTPRITLVAGVFSVKKPYFGLDPALRFGQLGTVDNRGVELSLTGTLLPGLSMVAGTVLLDSRISGEAVTSGRIGPRPVGSVRRRSILNLDWKPAGQTHWSFDSAIESLSSRVGNTANRLVAPARTTLALGTRYRTSIGGMAALFRVQVTNVFNEYGWLVSNSGGFTYSPGRTFVAQLAVDL
ncbi:TonB-dependent receptor [Sphingomonas sp. SUN039]|uniref:TonB-dependent receptor n=1 Tax=Sphingomonas sp. SUN039 TaxID=2937787 RepID=UPI002164C77C|nr:TonB-dependent receptor [Sphingomonas sp. SUN039]UVO55204.1 TonB-dependent receptor [Sphingomonas sp. SUN039]